MICSHPQVELFVSYKKSTRNFNGMMRCLTGGCRKIISNDTLKYIFDRAGGIEVAEIDEFLEPYVEELIEQRKMRYYFRK